MPLDPTAPMSSTAPCSARKRTRAPSRARPRGAAGARARRPRPPPVPPPNSARACVQLEAERTGSSRRATASRKRPTGGLARGARLPATGGRRRLRAAPAAAAAAPRVGADRRRSGRARSTAGPHRRGTGAAGRRSRRQLVLRLARIVHGVHRRLGRRRSGDRPVEVRRQSSDEVGGGAAGWNCHGFRRVGRLSSVAWWSCRWALWLIKTTKRLEPLSPLSRKRR